MDGQRILFVTAGGPHPWIIANALIDRFGPVPAIVEEPEPKSALIRRRIKADGAVSAIGQLATMVAIKLLKAASRRGIERLVAAENLQTEPRAGQHIEQIPSVNDPAFLDAIARLEPDLIFVAGARLIRRDVLAQLPCPVVNYHAGITPAYRGMNGGYWALASGDAGSFGGTVHFVDPGVDTGGVIRQARGRPERGDTIATYAYRQAALCRDICVKAAEAVLAGKAATFDPGLPSRLWRHPPIWSYLWTGLTRGVW